MGDEIRPVVVGLGELLWDCFGDSRRPGGAPANVAFHACQLGARGIVCSCVGTEHLGEELVEFLYKQGLETKYVQIDIERPTGKVTVDTTVADHPVYTIHEGVAWDAIEFDLQTEQLMREADAVCFGSLAQRSPRSRRTILRCLQATRPECLRVFDVNLRQEWYTREIIEDSLKLSRIVKLNEAEVGVLNRLLEIGADVPVPFARELQERFDVEVVCVTRAENGCRLVPWGDVIDVPGTPVVVADAVGAGDAFTAALIVTQLAGWPLQSSAEFANRVGGLVAGRDGAMPELADELAELRRQWEPHPQGD